MDRTISRSLDQLEREHLQLFTIVSPLTVEQYFRSIDKKWSVAQILTHLATSEALALGYMQKKSLGIEALPDTNWREPLKLALLKLSQRLPIKYKAPAGILEKTPAPMGKEDLFAYWKNNTLEMRRFLEELPGRHAQKKIFKHPIAGMFNAAQGLSFLREHLLHHLPQIKRHLNEPV